uniref:Indole-3-acetic acid-induced protein ARG7 n=1 Tax=Anthurium amnicola TaxID=1678845 RepID=A0A1D1YW66_9ARAE
MSSAMKKVEKIRQIVQLKQVVRRWKDLSLRRLHRPGAVGDYGGGPSGRPAPPGSLAVYVGPERRRFVIPTRFLNFPVFASLLKQAEEEFGFSSAGGLALPCGVEFFRHVLELLDNDEPRFKGLSLDRFLELAGPDAPDPSTCRDELGAADRCDGFSPLLTKTRV